MQTKKHGQYTQSGRILHILKAEGHITNARMIRMGIPRYGGRIFELRTEGHKITSNLIKDGLYDYIYKGEK